MTAMVLRTHESNLIAIWLSRLGLGLCVLASLLWISDQYGTLSRLNPYYRINTPALSFLFGFMVAAFSMRSAIRLCVFALPLLPTVAWQFQMYTGYGRIQDVPSAGLDLVVGILTGLVIHSFWQKKNLQSRVELPWPAGLAMVILTISVSIAISRNLHQSASPFTLQALLYNLVNMRSLGWHDDYRPLVDWAAYSIAFLLLALFVPELKNAPNRNDIIFKPLLAGLLIAALVAWRQASFGVGLNHDQMNFRSDRFGFVAFGFQPDLHAFGAHMLLGAVGLLGYLYYQKKPSFRLLMLATVIPMCWLGLFLSKSKATLVLAILGLFTIAAIWLFRHAKHFKRSVLGIFLFLTTLILSILVFNGFWTSLLIFVIQKFNLPDLHALNLKLSYRPEVYLAAFRMLGLFPFAGLGQSEFYRQSANHDLTNSLFLSVEQNGENAHNYFLQTLVELGILGFGAFLFFLLYPLLHTKDKRALIPAIVALLAIFAGNVFAHSMLVRENLLLAACFVALLYASIVSQEKYSAQGQMPPVMARTRFMLGVSKRLALLNQPKVLFAAAIISMLLIAKETYQSFKGGPFNVDVQCQEARRLYSDGWTSARYLIDVPVGALGMVLNLATTQPDVATRPLPGSLAISFNRDVLLKTDFILNRTGAQSLAIDLPEGRIATPDDYQIELTLQRCFIPKNFGMNNDGRRLGVRIESVHWK